LLVDEELARAIRHESAAAIQFWWGVSGSVVTTTGRAFNEATASGPWKTTED
jgi:hypothetical protein